MQYARACFAYENFQSEANHWQKVDVAWINESQHFDISTMFCVWTTSSSIYLLNPGELEIKDTIKSSTSASCLDILLKIDTDSKLTTQLYNKRFVLSTSLVYAYIYVATK
jgi:hypothetical protein